MRARQAVTMSDPDVCVFCSARGCLAGTAQHGDECPFTTSMWPVDADLVRRGSECMACGEAFREGDLSAQVKADSHPASGFANTLAAEWSGVGEVTFSLCLPCAAIGRPITEPCDESWRP